MVDDDIAGDGCVSAPVRVLVEELRGRVVVDLMSVAPHLRRPALAHDQALDQLDALVRDAVIGHVAAAVETADQAVAHDINAATAEPLVAADQHRPVRRQSAGSATCAARGKAGLRRAHAAPKRRRATARGAADNSELRRGRARSVPPRAEQRQSPRARPCASGHRPVVLQQLLVRADRVAPHAEASEAAGEVAARPPRDLEPRVRRRARLHGARLRNELHGRALRVGGGCCQQGREDANKRGAGDASRERGASAGQPPGRVTWHFGSSSRAGAMNVQLRCTTSIERTPNRHRCPAAKTDMARRGEFRSRHSVFYSARRSANF